jgi:hypothetical protein
LGRGARRSVAGVVLATGWPEACRQATAGLIAKRSIAGRPSCNEAPSRLRSDPPQRPVAGEDDARTVTFFRSRITCGSQRPAPAR